MDIEDIYIKLAHHLNQTYLDKTPNTQSIIFKGWIYKHQVKAAEILTVALAQKISGKIIEAWLNEVIVDLDKIHVQQERDWMQDTSLNKDIDYVLEQSKQFFDIYITHFLPLAEKQQLQNSITPPTESEPSTEKVHKI